MNRVALGRQGEEETCRYVQNTGMAVLERNYFTRTGEIDIIARDGETIVFIEVKTRRGTRYGSAAEAVTPAKIKKILRAAQAYIQAENLHDSNFRFDVAEVYGQGGRFEINYIKHAFEV